MTVAAESTPETPVDPEVVEEQPTEHETVEVVEGEQESPAATDASDAVADATDPALEPVADEAADAHSDDDVSIADAAIEETAVEEIPVDGASVEESPAEPVEEAPVEEASVEEAAVTEALVEESAVAEEPTDAEPVQALSAAEAVAVESETVTAVRASVSEWGRVDDDGTVSVREGDEWRVVGQYPDGSVEEALAYFERKYADLASEVSLLEVRHRRGGASASDLRTTARIVREKLVGAAAVGDLASLTTRVAALTDELAAATASEAAAAREAVDDAVKSRTEIVEKAEAIAARDPKSVQWKQASADMSALFDAWQAEQRSGARLPKSTGQQLWKRFRDARATVDKHRREFYTELDEAHKVVRDRKSALVAKAEALAPKGEDGIGAYRELLDQWKTAGRAGKKVDDTLWARFKAAGDALYGARGEREAAEAESSREKIAQKRELLQEASAVADEPEIAAARQLLTGIQRRWDDIGRIFPREAERALDDDLRKIEQALRTREDADWKRNNPETKARANDMTRQLTEAIEKLELDLAAAKKSGDKGAVAKAEEALEARKAWLRAVGG